MNSKKIVALASPTFTDHATTKGYVDSKISSDLAAGLATKGDQDKTIRASGSATYTRGVGSSGAFTRGTVSSSFNSVHVCIQILRQTE